MPIGKIIRSWLGSVFFGDEPEEPRAAMPVRSPGEDTQTAARPKRKRAMRRRKEPRLDPDEDADA